MARTLAAAVKNIARVKDKHIKMFLEFNANLYDMGLVSPRCERDHAERKQIEEDWNLILESLKDDE